MRVDVSELRYRFLEWQDTPKLPTYLWANEMDVCCPGRGEGSIEVRSGFWMTQLEAEFQSGVVDSPSGKPTSIREDVEALVKSSSR